MKSPLTDAVLIERSCPQGQDEHSCFIFSGRSGSFFRVYDPKDKSKFVDYEIANGITPFVRFKHADDVELKTYRLPDGSLKRVMGFTERAMSCGKVEALKRGEIQRSEFVAVTHPLDQAEPTKPPVEFQLHRMNVHLHWIEEHAHSAKFHLGNDKRRVTQELENLIDSITKMHAHLVRLEELVRDPKRG